MSIIGNPLTVGEIKGSYTIIEEQDSHGGTIKHITGDHTTVKSLNITNNGTYTAPSGYAYTPITVNIPIENNPIAEENDVIFIDYDGTIRYSYTAAEFANLTNLPPNPIHNGLTAQGWNWTLAGAKNYVAETGGLVIGQYYITDDGKTRIYIELLDDRTEPALYLGSNGGVNLTIDWGDGSSTESYSTVSVGTYPHTYNSGGNYIITLTNSSSGNLMLGKGIFVSAADDNKNFHYRDCVKKIEIGSNVEFWAKGYSGSDYSCRNLHNLETITIPRNFSYSTGDYCFGNCYKLKAFIGNTSTLPSYCFYNCYSLKYFSAPEETFSVYSGGSYFAYCYALRRIHLNQGSLSNYAFYYSGIIKASFKKRESPNEGFTPLSYNFAYCNSLREVNPNIVVMNTSNSYAFRECYSLTNITISSDTTNIPTYAFYYCYSMKEIHFKPETPPTIASSYVFSSLPRDCIIYVPYSNDHSILTAYQQKTNMPNPNNYTYMEE